MGKPTKAKLSRAFCYTLNNYTDEEVEILKNIPVKYHVFGYEKVSTPHIQGYIHFTNQTSFKAAKKKISPRAHVEKRKGTAWQASVYCKKDGDFFETGQLPTQGQRTDLIDVYEMAKANVKDTVISDYAPKCYMRHYKAIDRVRVNFLQENKGYEKLNVYYIWSTKSGIGKTKAAHDIDPNLFTVTDYRWWNGYIGQETVLLDDFYNQEIPYGYLLRLLDGYKFHLPTKGGFTWKMYKNVIITSNRPLSDLFTSEQLPAIQRRVNYTVPV